MNIIKKINYLLRYSLLFIFDLLKTIPKSIMEPTKKLLKEGNWEEEMFLIKSDEIGDYLLFRNFLLYIKSNEVYKNYKVVLCGNSAWKNIAENLDQKFVDEFVWMDKKKFSTNLFYRSTFLKMISERKPLVSINCSYSRNYFIDDSIIHVTNSKFKVGFKTDLSNSYAWQIKLSDNYYDELINTEGVDFDFYKNKILFETLFKIKIPIEKPFINCISIKSNFDLAGNYAVLFLGGRKNYKRWDVENFVNLGEHILQKFNLKLILCGSSKEIPINKKFINKIKSKESIIDLASKTALIDVIKLIKNAKILISNDSGIVHIAASLNTPAVVLANGTHFGRFLPYPNHIKNSVRVIYPQHVYDLLKDENLAQRNLQYRSLININTINYNAVIDLVNGILESY